MLPSLGRMAHMYDARDVAYATYVAEYIAAFDKDPRVKGFLNALAENYASRFAGWLGYVFLNRATKSRKSKPMKALEEGLSDWVENIPGMLEQRAQRDVAAYVPEVSRRFLNWKIVEAIGRKVLKVVYSDYVSAAAGRMASRKASLNQLPIAYDKRWRKYVIEKSQMTYRYKNDLKDLGFKWSGPRGVWFIDHLDSDVLKKLPQAGKIRQGPPPPKAPPMVGQGIDTEEWFFGDWLPANINRFSTVFNSYGKAEGVPYEFKFTVVGKEVEIDFRRNIRDLDEAIQEIRSRYGKKKDRGGWMLAVDAYLALKKAKGKGAMAAIDRANDLEHSHGSMLEHFPAGVQKWYPAFLDFKYTADPKAMVKKIHSEDLRTALEELLPLHDRMHRLVTPKTDYRTPKGLALEILSQKGAVAKRKKLEEIKTMHSDIWPSVVKQLKERSLPKGMRSRLASRRVRN